MVTSVQPATTSMHLVHTEGIISRTSVPNGREAAWANAGYSGKLATWAASLKITLEIVRKRDGHAFEVLPRRWVVERTLPRSLIGISWLVGGPCGDTL